MLLYRMILTLSSAAFGKPDWLNGGCFICQRRLGAPSFSFFCILYIPHLCSSLQILSPHVDKSIYPLIPLSLHNYFHPAPIFRWVCVPCFSDTSNFKRTGIAAQFLLIFSSEISTKHLQSTCTYHFANCAASTLGKKI